VAGAQSTLVAVMQSAPGFTLAKTRYAEMLKKVAVASEKREVALSADETALEALISQALAQPIPSDERGAKAAYGFRAMGIKLGVFRVRRALRKGGVNVGATWVVTAEIRPEVERRERELFAAIDRLRAEMVRQGVSDASADISPDHKRLYETVLGDDSGVVTGI